MKFKDKVVLITGGAGYIGGETALAFAAEGAKIAVCDINKQSLDRVTDEIKRLGGETIGHVIDVTDSKSVDDAVLNTVDTLGGLDVVVHIAGGSARIAGGEYVTLDMQTDEVIDTVLKVNLYGALYISRAAARVMIEQNRKGRIINFSSIVGINGLKHCVEYAAAKAGVIGLTKALAKELGEYKITVNSVAPGVVQRPGESDEAINTNLLKEKCTATDVAKLVLFLSSEDAHFITGQTYVIDGGRSLSMKGTD